VPDLLELRHFHGSEVDMSACTSTGFTIGTHVMLESTVVVAAGEIDLANREALRASLDACDGDVVVDLTDVQLLDAGGIGVLVGARNRLRGVGGSLVLHDPRPNVRRALEAVGLETWIAA
jgi:anti-sigma B factor antagonist/stage II sporulation protein AA (anti-sigma F factor antagonist)